MGREAIEILIDIEIQTNEIQTDESGYAMGVVLIQ
jgi:hypothetical protein